MNLTDGIDLVADLLPRKARHAVGIVLIILCLWWPSAISRFVTWYATEKSHEIVHQIQQHIPTVQQPMAPAGGSSPTRDHRLGPLVS